MQNLYKNYDGSYLLSEGELINKKELIKRLNVTRRTVQRMMNRGLPYIRFANYVAFEPKKVDEWLIKNNYGPISLISKWNKEKQEERNNGN